MSFFEGKLLALQHCIYIIILETKGWKEQKNFLDSQIDYYLKLFIHFDILLQILHSFSVYSTNALSLSFVHFNSVPMLFLEAWVFQWVNSGVANLTSILCGLRIKWSYNGQFDCNVDTSVIFYSRDCNRIIWHGPTIKGKSWKMLEN